jgi:hypothetical protein
MIINNNNNNNNNNTNNNMGWNSLNLAAKSRDLTTFFNRG